MRLTVPGVDSGPSGSPRAYATDRDTYVVRGYRVEDLQTLSQLEIPYQETVIEIPTELLKHLRRD